MTFIHLLTNWEENWPMFSAPTQISLARESWELTQLLSCPYIMEANTKFNVISHVPGATGY